MNYIKKNNCRSVAARLHWGVGYIWLVCPNQTWTFISLSYMDDEDQEWRLEMTKDPDEFFFFFTKMLPNIWWNDSLNGDV